MHIPYAKGLTENFFGAVWLLLDPFRATTILPSPSKCHKSWLIIMNNNLWVIIMLRTMCLFVLLFSKIPWKRHQNKKKEIFKTFFYQKHNINSVNGKWIQAQENGPGMILQFLVFQRYFIIIRIIPGKRRITVFYNIFSKLRVNGKTQDNWKCDVPQ